jgi:hypothetical protein
MDAVVAFIANGEANGPAASLIPSVKAAVDEVNHDITLQFRTLALQVDESLGRERLDSITYVAAIETAEQFGKRLYVEAGKRGWSRAERNVVMGDGSEWIWNQANEHFPGATQIVDLYHAREHLWELVRKLHPNAEVNQNRWMLIHQDLLRRGENRKTGVFLAVYGNIPYGTGREDSYRGRIF